MSHVFIMNEAIKIGFYPKDLFILLAKNRLTADWLRIKKIQGNFILIFGYFKNAIKKLNIYKNNLERYKNG